MKKIISIALSLAMLLSICLVGVSVQAEDAPATDVEVVEVPKVVNGANLLLNGSFEQGSNYGFANTLPAHGQYITLLDSWIVQHWWQDDNQQIIEENKIFIDHVRNAKDGNYALKFRTSASENWPGLTMYPFGYNVDDINELATGTYRLSFWVKGDSQRSKVTYKDAEGTEHEVKFVDRGVNADEWTKIVIDGIEGFNILNIGDEYSSFSGNIPNIKFKILGSTVASTVYIDNVVLEKVAKKKVSNYIINPGFETETDISTIKVDPSVNGQTQKIAEGYWTAMSYGCADAAVTYTTDAHSGDYALNVQIADEHKHNSWEKHTFNLTPKNFDIDSIEPGYYTFSVWVKGNAVKSYLKFGSENVNVPASAADKWTQIIIDDIYISGPEAFTLAGTGDGGDAYRYSNLAFVAHHGTLSTNISFDDFCLEKTKNLFSNYSLETAKTRGAGFENYKPVSGQHPTLVDSWRDWSWNSGKLITHSTENPHSGTYAIRMTWNSNNSGGMLPELQSLKDIVISKTVTAEDGSEKTQYYLPAGTYRMSAYVRGSGSNKVRMFLPNNPQDYNQISAITEEWTEVAHRASYAEDVLITTDTPNGSSVLLTSNIKLDVSTGAEGDWVEIDDISLVKLDSAEYAAQNTTLAQPKVGATRLAAPVINATNNVKATIKASSDENVIALDGTITTPEIRKIVNVTYEISDGATTVQKTFAVLVHGSMDQYNANNDDEFNTLDLVQVRKSLLGVIKDSCLINADEVFDIRDLIAIKKAFVNKA